jgi:glycosyltransferase involved in cell wall biosynthesis
MIIIINFLLLFFNSLSCLSVLVVGRDNNDFGICKITKQFIDFFEKENIDVSHKSVYSNNAFLDAKTISNDNYDIGIFTDVLLYQDLDYNFYLNNCKLRICYSMIESTTIPEDWKNKINNFYHCVFVPNDYVKQVYVDSGCNVPVYVIPFKINSINNISRNKRLDKQRKKFINFGFIGSYSQRKNTKKLIDSFVKLLEIHPHCNLILHSNLAFGDHGSEYTKLKNYVDSINCKNITLSYKNLNLEDYYKLIDSFDVFISVSKGEGCSLAPRESLLISKPCILSCNTAHIELCKLPGVIGVPCNIEEDAFYESLKMTLGIQYDCDKNDVVNCMSEMIKNYDFYKDQAYSNYDTYRRSFCDLFDENLKIFFTKQIVMENSNYIDKNIFTTDNQELFKIMNNLFARQNENN